MGEMIDRAARALFEHEQRMSSLEFPGFDGVFGWDSPTFKGRDMYRAKARCMIEAIFTPTHGQRNAYYELSHKTETMFDAHWERAIDAILSEKTEDVA